MSKAFESISGATVGVLNLLLHDNDAVFAYGARIGRRMTALLVTRSRRRGADALAAWTRRLDPRGYPATETGDDDPYIEIVRTPAWAGHIARLNLPRAAQTIATGVRVGTFFVGVMTTRMMNDDAAQKASRP